MRRALKPIDLTLEREIQADCIKLYRSLEIEYAVFTQYGRTGGTHQTPGIADLKLYCARKDATWWHEVKTPTGVQSEAQRDFQRMVESCHEIYLLGGTEVALIHLQAIGVLGPGLPPRLLVRFARPDIARLIAELDARRLADGPRRS